MKVIVTGRNLHVRETMADYVEKKLAKFDKYFRNEVEVHATFSHQKADQIVEITIPLKNDVIFRVEERTGDMYASIDQAVDKLAKQISKHKTKIEKRFRGHDTIRFEEIPSESLVEETESALDIVKTKRFPIKPMDPEEAVLQMEMLGHNFYVFLNGETDEVNVVYGRKDGRYGLIEPEL